jgi:hypothetical protein
VYTAIIAGGALSLAVSSQAIADSGGAGNSSPAVVGPALRTLKFGDTTGLNLGCAAGLGVVSAGASGVPGASQLVGPVQGTVASSCAQVSTQGAGYIDAFNAAVAPLAILNPDINPFIAASAQAMQTIGTDYASSIAPFGPTVVGLGTDIQFFEGS